MNAKEVKHTPTPWKVTALPPVAEKYIATTDTLIGIHNEYGIDGGIGLFGHPKNSTAAANATFIVTACNSHDDLVAALKNMTVWAIGACTDKDQPQRILNAISDLRVAVALLRKVGVDPHVRDIGLNEIEAEAIAAIAKAAGGAE